MKINESLNNILAVLGVPTPSPVPEGMQSEQKAVRRGCHSNPDEGRRM